jgi:hypothetical protein
MKHRGPLVSELENYKKKYKWPDVRLKLSFTKVVSDKWKSMLDKYTFPQEKVIKICRDYLEKVNSIIKILEK